METEFRRIRDGILVHGVDTYRVPISHQEWCCLYETVRKSFVWYFDKTYLTKLIKEVKRAGKESIINGSLLMRTKMVLLADEEDSPGGAVRVTATYDQVWDEIADLAKKILAKSGKKSGRKSV